MTPNRSEYKRLIGVEKHVCTERCRLQEDEVSVVGVDVNSIVKYMESRGWIYNQSNNGFDAPAPQMRNSRPFLSAQLGCLHFMVESIADSEKRDPRDVLKELAS